VDVIHAGEHTGSDAVHSELALIKVKYTSAAKPIILKLIKKYATHILNESDNILIISQTGTTEHLDELETLLKKYHMIEMVRTGKVVMAKGHDET
jgi:acetolactate synthase small subunit